MYQEFINIKNQENKEIPKILNNNDKDNLLKKKFVELSVKRTEARNREILRRTFFYGK